MITDNATITLKNIIDEDFVNYRVPSMSLIFPYCTFKCGIDNCQNKDVANDNDVVVSIKYICERYINNPISKAIVCQGLEPLDSFNELFNLINILRNNHCDDDIVIYTGYNKDEIRDKVDALKHCFKNIIIKFGRYIPDQEPHYDDILGVNLASDNQYAEKIS